MFTLDTELTSRNGFDKLELLIEFLPIIHAEDSDQFDTAVNAFIGYIQSEIKREISIQEHANILEGISNYIKSDEASNERMKAIKYFSEAQFLVEDELVGKLRYLRRLSNRLQQNIKDRGLFEASITSKRLGKHEINRLNFEFNLIKSEFDNVIKPSQKETK